MTLGGWRDCDWVGGVVLSGVWVVDEGAWSMFEELVWMAREASSADRRSVRWVGKAENVVSSP